MLNVLRNKQRQNTQDVQNLDLVEGGGTGIATSYDQGTKTLSATISGGGTAALALAAAGGTTSALLPFAPGITGGFIVIDPYTVECEVRRISSVVGATVNFSPALSFAHVAGDPVLFWPGGEAPVSWFAPAGDGATDDTAKFQAGLTCLAVAGVSAMRVPSTPAGYRIAGGLTSAVSLVGDGMHSSLLIFDDVTGVGITMTGALSTDSRTVFDSVPGGVTIELVPNAGANYAAGDIVFVYDTYNIPGTAAGETNTTLVTRVRSVSGDVLTLEDSFPDVIYGATGHVVKLVAVQGASVKGIGLKVATAYGAVPANRKYLLSITRASDVDVEGCLFEGAETCLFVSVSRNARIRGNSFENARDLSTHPGTTTASAISVYACTGSVVTGNTSSGCSTGCEVTRSPNTTVGGNSFGGGALVNLRRGIKVEWGSNDCVVHGNVISDFSYGGCHHDSAKRVAWVGNIVRRTHDTSAGSGNGIALYGEYSEDNSVVGNIVSKTYGPGILVSGGKGAVVRGNVLTDVNTGANLASIYVTGLDHIVEGNRVRTWFTGGFGITLTGAAATSNCVVCGNLLDNAGSGCAISTTGTDGGNHVLDNVQGAESLLLDVLDHYRAPKTTKTVAYAAAVTPRLDASHQLIVLTGALTLNNPSSSFLPNGALITLDLANSTGGAITPTWGTAWKRIAGADAGLPLAANSRRLITFRCDGTDLVEQSRTLDIAYP